MTLSRRQARQTRLMVRLLSWAYLQPILASGDMYIKVTWVVRSSIYQRVLVKLRRSRTLQGYHQDGLAWDIQLYWRDGTPAWGRQHYAWIGEEAERIGLEWGGNWKKLIDSYHIQERRK